VPIARDDLRDLNPQLQQPQPGAAPSVPWADVRTCRLSLGDCSWLGESVEHCRWSVVGGRWRGGPWDHDLLAVAAGRWSAPFGAAGASDLSFGTGGVFVHQDPDGWDFELYDVTRAGQSRAVTAGTVGCDEGGGGFTCG
jgi:hypothetical protein